MTDSTFVQGEDLYATQLVVGDPDSMLPLCRDMKVDGVWWVPETRMYRTSEILAAVEKARAAS